MNFNFSKTTAIGVLSFASITFTTIAPFLALPTGANGTTHPKLAIASAGVAIASALTRAWIAFFQKDAEKITTADVEQQTQKAIEAAPSVPLEPEKKP